MASVLTVGTIRRVYDDGNHNAFTDICRYHEKLYLTFRNCPDGHMLFATSRILVLSSENGVDWQEVLAFSVPNRDVRDPHLLVYRDTLYVYSGTWLVDPSDSSNRDLDDMLGHACWTTDGTTWHGPRTMPGTEGHYVWRAATDGQRAYLCGRRKRGPSTSPEVDARVDPSEGAMLVSDDGLSWETAGLFQEAHGNETAFLFESDGEVLAVARGRHPRPAQVCRSRPPYDAWTRTDLAQDLGGPMLAKWGGRYLVGGRNGMGTDHPQTALYWLEDDTLREIAVLPSGGDNSYPGFVVLSDTLGLLSFYSSHEGSGTSLAPSAIYVAELHLD